MNEHDLEQIEKIVQHTAKTITHNTAPETRELIKGLSDKFEEHKVEERALLEKTIKEVVNGKIDKTMKMLGHQMQVTNEFHTKVNNHISRVEPVIRAYEENQEFKKGAEHLSKTVVFIAKVLGALSIIWVSAKYLIFGILLNPLK